MFVCCKCDTAKFFITRQDYDVFKWIFGTVYKNLKEHLTWSHTEICELCYKAIPIEQSKQVMK